MTIEIKAYRKNGGAVVTVVRHGCEKKYNVGLKRFNRLKWVSSVWLGAHGHSSNNSLSINLESPSGYHDAVCWLLKHGCKQARQTMRA